MQSQRVQASRTIAENASRLEGLYKSVVWDRFKVATFPLRVCRSGTEGNSAPPSTRGNTRHSAHQSEEQVQVTDKTALEIAATEALFGQTGASSADEPWTLGLPSPWGATDANWYNNNNSSNNSQPQATSTTTGDLLFTRGGSGNSGASSSLRNRTKGGGDSLLVTSADAPSMGNYDRGDAHLRVQMPHRINQQQVSQVATSGTGAQLPHRSKTSASSSASSSTPYFHHFLDRSSSTSSLLFNPNSNYGESASVSISAPGKRPRPSNSISSSFITPLGFPSPPPFETDHGLPDFNSNWGFGGRNVARAGNLTSSAPISSSSTMTTTSHSSSNVTTNSSSFSGVGSGLSSPNGASMFSAVDSFLPDYDSTLYSLWNAPPSGGSVVGYETENDAAHASHHQQVQPPLYMASDDELKMLPEFNQDFDSYLNDTMESGGPSPTTPLGTSTAHSMMKMDHLVTTDRRANAGGVDGPNLSTGSREPHLERLLAPVGANTTAEYFMKRDRGLVDNAPERSAKRSRGAYDDAYAGASVSSGTSSVSSFRRVSTSTAMESKRAAMPSLDSYHSGSSLLASSSAAENQSGAASTGTETPTTVVPSTSTLTPTTSETKTSRRPRSRQCEFPGCQNRARSHQKCKKHGGAHQCVFEGCTKNSQSRGLCIAHGGGSRCKREGCVRAAQSKGLCKSHGGGEYCAVEGCNKKAHLKHLCRTHGGGVRCKIDKCSKWAQRKGWCMAHAKEFAAT